MVTVSVPLPVLAVAFQMLCAVGDALYPTYGFADPYGEHNAAPDDPDPDSVALAKNWFTGWLALPAVDAWASVAPPELVNAEVCAATRYPLAALVCTESTTLAVLAEAAPGMAIRVMPVDPLPSITHPLGEGPQVLEKVSESGMGVNVTALVVPESIDIVAVLFVVTSDE